MNRCALLLATLLVGLTGCASSPRATPQYFVLDPGRAPSVKALRAGDRPATAAVSFVDVAAPFATNGFVYQVGAHGWETDPYNQFLVSPADMTTSVLRGWLRQSGLYGEVAEPGSAGGQDLLIDADLTELYGDFRNAFAPIAVIALEVQVLRATDRGRVLVMRKKYAQSVPVAARTPVALVDAWNEGLRVSLNLLLRDLATARLPAATSSSESPARP